MDGKVVWMKKKEEETKQKHEKKQFLFVQHLLLLPYAN
jgi:hypothetical protein